MPKPRFHIVVAFLGRSRQKKSAGNDTYSVPWRGGGVPWSGVEGSAVRSGVGYLQAHRQPAKHSADSKKAKP